MAFDRRNHKARAVVSSSRRPLVSELARYGRLLEVGIGNRPAVASAVAERGRDVVGIDIDPGGRTLAAERDAKAAEDSTGGSFEVIEGDVVSLAESERTELTPGEAPEHGIDAVYACHLPAELQRSTVDLAERLNADCLFTTLGFEEPVVPVTRRTLSETTLYVARDRDESPPTDRR